MITGPNAVRYVQSLNKRVQYIPRYGFEREQDRQQSFMDKIYQKDGSENVYQLHQELGNIMTENVTVVRYNKKLQETDNKIQELQQRWHHIKLADKGKWANQEACFTRHLWHMLQLARVITLGALARNESRGAHYKPEFPDRDDANWLKTTKAKFTPNGPELSYEEVDTSLIKPRPRRYDVDKEAVGK